jgi:hypothetical protein
LARAAQSADEGGPEAVAVRPAAAEPAEPAVPPAAAEPAEPAVPPAALLVLGLPLHEESIQAPPAAAANRRNVRRPG